MADQKGQGAKLLHSRDGGIRTRDPLNPIQVRYRTALRPVRMPEPAQTEELYSSGSNTCSQTDECRSPCCSG